MLSFFKLEIAPNQTLRVNINSPNFFITNFNDMKRMNLIRVALLAVFAFMGTISLSAQNGWLPPAPAVVVISNQLTQLQDGPTKTAPSQGATIQSDLATNGCTDCFLNSVKVQYLNLTLLKLKEGASDTGTAVQDVRAFMISKANNNATMLNTIQQGFTYMESIL